VPPYLERGHDLTDHGQVQRVEGLGPVEGNHPQAAMGAEEDLVLGGRRRRAHKARLDLRPAWRAHSSRSPVVRREAPGVLPQPFAVRTRRAAGARRASLQPWKRDPHPTALPPTASVSACCCCPALPRPLSPPGRPYRCVAAATAVTRAAAAAIATDLEGHRCVDLWRACRQTTRSWPPGQPFVLLPAVSFARY